MLKIKDKKFQVKFIEMNLRERMYQEKSIVTLIINVEFYPEIFNDSVIYGAIEIKTDLENMDLGQVFRHIFLRFSYRI